MTEGQFKSYQSNKYNLFWGACISQQSVQLHRIPKGNVLVLTQASLDDKATSGDVHLWVHVSHCSPVVVCTSSACRTEQVSLNLIFSSSGQSVRFYTTGHAVPVHISGYHRNGAVHVDQDPEPPREFLDPAIRRLLYTRTEGDEEDEEDSDYSLEEIETDDSQLMEESNEESDDLVVKDIPVNETDDSTIEDKPKT
eukprot:NODE_8007_length_719_cov_54.679530_g7391_i0.p1 GENE.NODE_8007_length_719_cov_54.679530_g7391_i0~~NODE_8007_length_719_cov_54.679530_g7391_i0.p1  ORF type:complete len:196 (+),score=41.08 NODE_8007_length_719_cov_54.679530_g7391_i0:82-669(+)